VHEAVDLLSAWPGRFLEFALATGITQQHFSGSETLQPSWMTAVIQEHLSLQRRGISVEDARRAIENLAREGAPVTKASVNHHLGANNAAAVSLLLARRSIATPEEIETLAATMRTRLDLQLAKRISEWVIARNIVLLVIQILCGISVNEAAQLDRARIAALFEGGQYLDERLREVGGVGLRRLAALESGRQDYPLQPVRGRAVCPRSVANELARCMRSLDCRLSRNTKVFLVDRSAAIKRNASPNSLQHPSAPSLVNK
jgi:hypothetical protein